MADPLYRQLLSQARRLAELDKKKPKQGNLRRAVSTAYYALYHCLVDRACRSMLGTTNTRRPYRDVLARAFQHSTMGKACKSFAGGTLPKHIDRTLRAAAFTIPPDLRRVAQTFQEAQEKRHLADYDPAWNFSRAEVKALIRDVELAMDSFTAMRGRAECQFFLSCLLTWGTLPTRK